METILVTGGVGAIGSVLLPRLTSVGWPARVLDVAGGAASRGDIRSSDDVAAAVSGVAGVIHMAAVSRVVWGEEDPERCWAVNVEGTRNVLAAAMSAPQKPWVLFVSSREVYGNPPRLPVVEGDPVSPVNTYGRSKAEGESIVAAARSGGLVTACIRLPSVYGSVNDIPDRVIPAFVARARAQQPLRITDPAQLCDFLHVNDAVDGLLRAAEKLKQGESALPTVHLASGRGTSLRELANLVRQLANSSCDIIEEAPRPFDVRGFVGDPARARRVLNWTPTIALEDGIARVFAGHS